MTNAAQDAPLPPQNLEAEEYVLGAMMLAQTAIAAVRPIVQPRDFYRDSHARIYRAAIDLDDTGTAVDPITVADELDERGELQEVGGKDRIREIASLAPVVSSAKHWADIVAEMARLRDITTVGARIQQLGWERGADTAQLLQKARELVAGLRERETRAPIEWLTHQAVLELHTEQERNLVDDLIPAGAVGTIAGVPETHKSWLAQAIAIRVARGNGYILGKQVVAQGPVGYLWQDDSTREEAERVKHFEHRHPNPANLPILWALNLGLELPRDIPRLRHEVEQNRLALLVIDSFYNFLPGVDLKDDQAEQVVSQLKREIADQTGCTILIVDHMPWATDANRTRLRAYGGVFKNAATRFGIYIDAIGETLHIEARGNNIRGITKRLAYWDANTLELKLVSDSQTDDDSSETSASKIAEWVREQEGSEVEIKHVLAYFEISDDTLRRRVARLTELGVDWIARRGPKLSRLVARPIGDDSPPAEEQLDIDANFRTPQLPHAEHSNGAANKPHNEAKTEFRTATSADPPCGTTETPDMQGKTHAATSAPPTGVEPPCGIPPETHANGHPTRHEIEAWIDQHGYTAPDPGEALLNRYPHLQTRLGELERHIARAETRAARELGA